MSKIALPIAELKPALTGLGKIINRHTAQPALKCIKVERTADGWIALSATDLDHHATVRLEQPSNGTPMSLLVPYDELLKVTKTCPKTDNLLVGATDDGAITIEYAIGNQVAETRVESSPVENFPPTPQISGEFVAVNQRLRTSIHEALECASSDGSRQILQGAYIDVTDAKCHHVVGTDGRHLYSSNSFSLPLKQSLVIPAHKFLSWKEFNNDGEWQLQVGGDEENPSLQISSRRWQFISRCTEGSYPNWRQVVPNASTAATSFEFEPEAFASITQTIQRMPCHDATSFTIGLECISGKAWLIGKSPNADKWTRVEIPIQKFNGRDVTILLNRHYLMKALSFDLNKVQIIDALSPIKFKNDGRQMTVMPVRPEPKAIAAPTATAAPDEKPEPAPIERTPMVNPETPAPAASVKIEDALELIDSLKDSFQQGLIGLKDLSSKLKLIQREHKSSEREIQSVRSTLRSLQNVKL